MTEEEIEIINIDNNEGEETDGKNNSAASGEGIPCEGKTKMEKSKVQTKGVVKCKDKSELDETNEMCAQDLSEVNDVVDKLPVGTEKSHVCDVKGDDIIEFKDMKMKQTECESKPILNEKLHLDDKEVGSKIVDDLVNLQNINSETNKCDDLESRQMIERRAQKRKTHGFLEKVNLSSTEEFYHEDSTEINAKEENGYINEKKDSLKLVDYQVQCVNLHCQSGYGLAEAPVFVLTYYGATRRRNVLQKVCNDCFKMALHHQEDLVFRLKSHLPLLKAEFSHQKNDVVVMDPVEEIYEEEVLSREVIDQVNKYLPEIMEETLNKYDIEFQLDQANHILSDKLHDLAAKSKLINDEFNAIEKTLKEARALLYKDFTPRVKSLPSLDIIEPNEIVSSTKPLLNVRSKVTAKVQKNTRRISYEARKEAPSHDIVSVEEVEVPQNKIPPVGSLPYPIPFVGDEVYVMKISFFGVWVKGKIVEIVVRSPEQSPMYRVRFDISHRVGMTKVVSGKHLAYSKPSLVRYPVGTRVIALFKNSDAPAKEAYYVGVIAEPPKHINKFRYLVFFDDGYAQYVPHEKILLVCECSPFIHEDIHPDSRDFIKNYLDQYPERPMVKLQQGQIVRTEWNGKWWLARVEEVDGSLVKVYFMTDKRTEWIYRGSSRLGPLYSELVAAAARKEQGALSRHRSLGIASLKKRNMPYVEYSVDQDDAKTPNSATGVSKNVAKKSTVSKANAQESSTDKSSGPPKPFEKLEYVTKGYIRSINLSSRIKGRMFTPHQCGPSCTEWTNYSDADCRGINPLAIPLFFGFERQLVKVKAKRNIMYRAPCGRRLRNMVEVHRYLRITKTTMGLDLFDFDHLVHVLDEFHLENNMYCTHLKDISYGCENNPVSCVNEIDHSWPSFMDYSTCRIPQEGVNICLDEEFLVCCDCTDDCQDKEKCECWQLTIEGTKLGPEGIADPSVGYQNKRLLEPVTTGIYECNQRCKCASTCLNRVAQHPLQLNLQVFRTLKKGWGLRTLNDIPQGGFVCIYAGRLHTEQSANDVLCAQVSIVRFESNRTLNWLLSSRQFTTDMCNLTATWQFLNNIKPDPWKPEKDGRMYGDEYLAELDYIEVVERFKEGYESEVVEPSENNGDEDEEDHEEDFEHEPEEKLVNNDDKDYVPEGLNKLGVPLAGNVVNTRARKKKFSSEEKSESEGEKDKEDVDTEDEVIHVVEDDDEMKKKPSKFTAAVPVDEERVRNYKSVREMFGDGADDCYIMDAKSCGNIGRYLNHSCQPNVFVQNVFVDTHDVRFPWVAFFALTRIKAGTELTWDYNYDVGSVPDKVLYCYCNNAECRGRLL